MYYTVQHYGRQPSILQSRSSMQLMPTTTITLVPLAIQDLLISMVHNLGIAGYVVDPRCPEKPVGGAGDDGSNSNPAFPNSYRWAGAAGGSMFGRCGYDFAQDIMSIPRVKRNALLLKSTLEITPDVDAHAVTNDFSKRF